MNVLAKNISSHKRGADRLLKNGTNAIAKPQYSRTCIPRTGFTDCVMDPEQYYMWIRDEK